MTAPTTARKEAGTTAARAATMLHDHDPHAVVEQLLHELDEARAGTYTIEFRVEHANGHVLYKAAERNLARAMARRLGGELKVRTVTRGPWRCAT